MYRRIMVPVDGSHTSDLGLAAAIRMARNQKAQLCVLHVVDEEVVTRNVEAGAAEMDRLLESLREGGRRILERAQAAVRAQRVKSKGVLVENMVRSVSDVIVDQARKWRADLIVMGTHGRRGITRVLLGSAAEGVVRAAPVPVLLVRAPARKGG
jgi:nucleotide-binding universal stress UspA family protein